ncbi:hypothetical protein [Campylobacter devanensis]|uniref:hypothetical protein n=1 Tax=Campylobacter devanensis TaxID=3161138 RepID=UPI0015D7C9EC|nr:hypothetical protein [Campylobacter sp. P0087]
MSGKSTGITPPHLYFVFAYKFCLNFMPLQAYKYIKFMLYSLFLEMKQNHIFAKLVLKTIIFKTKPLSKINGAKAKFKSVLRSLFANRKSSKFMALTKKYIRYRNLIMDFNKF